MKGIVFMQRDAMNAGVNPGGLQSRIEIRVLICYILVNTNSPVPLETVKERLHFEGIANYFEVAFAISELLENNTIKIDYTEENGIQFYTHNKEAEAVSAALAGSLPFSVKEKAIALTKSIISRRKYERENSVDIKETENGLYITCSVMEKDLVLASITLLVPDEKTANRFKENFLENPVETLARATSALTKTEI